MRYATVRLIKLLSAICIEHRYGRPIIVYGTYSSSEAGHSTGSFRLITLNDLSETTHPRH